MSVDHELVSRLSGSVLTLTLNRPHAANSLNANVCRAFSDALVSASSDERVRAVVLTSVGGRVFCAGVDLKNPEALSPDRLAEQRAAIVADMISAILDFEKPFIVAVNGAAVGAGVFLAFLADRTFAMPKSRFQLPEIDVGMPTLVGIAILCDLAGSALATDLVLTGRSMSAEEAAGRSLVILVHSKDLASYASADAQSLGAKPVVALALNKRWINGRRREAINFAFETTRAQRHEVLATLNKQVKSSMSTASGTAGGDV